MNLDGSTLTLASATAGGLLIGAAAVLLMAGAGRIAGISGILGGLLPPQRDGLWRVAFLLGLCVAPWLYQLGAALPPITVEAGTLRLIVAGLLVGIGTRFASGCTSGHGVCGLSRGSRRSFVATALFMAAGFATVYAVRHGWEADMAALIAFASGLVFGLGLIVSGMANPAKVLGFLDIAGAWDPSLAFVMGGAVLATAAGFAVLRRRPASLSGEPLRWPTATRIDLRLAAGSLAFGAGWGLAGFCPGPALVAASAGVAEALIFVAAMIAGMGVFSAFEQFKSR